MTALLNAFLAGCTATPAANAYLSGDARTATIAGAFSAANVVAALLFVRRY